MAAKRFQPGADTAERVPTKVGPGGSPGGTPNGYANDYGCPGDTVANNAAIANATTAHRRKHSPVQTGVIPYPGSTAHFDRS